MRQKLIFIKYYFPGVDIESLTDEEFAQIANEADWLDAHQLKQQQVKALSLLNP